MSDIKTIFLSDDKIFYTLEGEGEYVGRPSVFMRLSMCNLTCKGFASADSPNGCDSFISWSVKNRMTFDEVFDYMTQNSYNCRLRDGAIWKITGGEPLIQQKILLDLVRDFAKRL
ncbi:7-carboxy-7-deazaguanine synthase QueE [bacterium]|nr:7-carboxy-7-deazaguanine synthase QueE [bacterium]